MIVKQYAVSFEDVFTDSQNLITKRKNVLDDALLAAKNKESNSIQIFRERLLLDKCVKGGGAILGLVVVGDRDDNLVPLLADSTYPMHLNVEVDKEFDISIDEIGYDIDKLKVLGEMNIA